MGYRKRRYYRSNSRRSYGSERAREHIRQAKQLSSELGGTDRDVKRYFFTLPADQLTQVFEKYGKAYGSSPREYAEKTLPKWKSGRVHMSGLVAERLFNLLPPMMPIEAKFRLTESLWKHVGPKSNKQFYVGTDASVEEVSQRVKEHLEGVVIPYKIPPQMEARFNWLSQGDVDVKQQLLNHFRQQEKLLLNEALKTQLPILIAHLNSDTGGFTPEASQILVVGKHEVRVTVHRQASGISEISPITAPRTTARVGAQQNSLPHPPGKQTNSFNWGGLAWILIPVGLALISLIK